MTNLTTVRDLIRWAASQFEAAGLYYGHGTDNAFDEAMHLVLQGIHLDPSIPDTYLDACLTDIEKRQLLTLIERRIHENIPVAYLVQQAWFAGLAFYVDARVLVPRSSIAELIEQQFEPWVDPNQVNTILEIGTGSGCIAIACAYAFPYAKVLATDIAPEALEVADRNVKHHGVENQVGLIHANVFNGVPVGKFDLIISNPPYVPEQEWSVLPKEYQHEPRDALVAGENGLAVVAALLKGAPDYLAAQGILVVEVGNTEQELLLAYPDLDCVWPEFQRGATGVFIMNLAQLMAWNVRYG